MSEANNGSYINSVSRPWYVYLMAIWAFFGTGSFLLTIAKALSAGNQSILQFVGVAAIILNITLITKIIKMDRTYLIIFGALCALLVLWQGFSLASVISSAGLTNPIVFLLLFYILPSLILAFLALRPKFLSDADKFSQYSNQEAIRKIAMKNA